MEAKKKLFEFGAKKQARQQNLHPFKTSGGDADHMICDLAYNGEHVCGRQCRYSDNYSIKSLYALNTHLRKYETTTDINANGECSHSGNNYTNTHSRKYDATTTTLMDGSGDRRYENDSNLNCFGNGSQESAKSQKSCKTVVSCKSSQDLKKLITSQCKLHEAVDGALKRMNNEEVDAYVEKNVSRLVEESLPTHCPLALSQCKRHINHIQSYEAIDGALKRMGNEEVDTNVEENASRLMEEPLPTHCPAALSQCKRCSKHIQAEQAQKDAMTEIDKGTFLDCHNNGALTISIDDVVNSKVINPMIRKLQRMYLNTHEKEMSLMDDLEQLPHKVIEVYKATIFKLKD